jgi:WD40 repeat protein
MHHYGRSSEPHEHEDGDDAAISPAWVDFAAVEADAQLNSRPEKSGSWGMWLSLLVIAFVIGGGLEYDHETRQIKADAQAQLEQMQHLLNHSLVRAVAFNADGTLLASGTVDGLVRVWDMASQSLRFTLRGHSGAVLTLAFSPDGKILASGGGDWPHESGELLLWDTADGQLRCRLVEPSAPVTCLAFTPDGRSLAACSGYGPIQRWDAASWSPLPTIAKQLEVSTFAIAADGQSLAAATLDHRVRLLDLSTGAERAVMDSQDYSVTALSFAPDDKNLMTGNVGGAVRTWNWTAPKDGRRLPEQDGDVPLRTIAFSPDGRWMAVACGSWRKPGFIRLWNVRLREERAVLHEPIAGVFGMAFTPDSKVLASGSGNHIVRLWDIATCTQRTELHADESDPNSSPP